MSLKITTIVILKIQLNQLKIREQNCTNTIIEQIKVQLNHINIKPNYYYYYYYFRDQREGGRRTVTLTI